MENISQVSRFLQQATLGADQRLLTQVAKMGIKPWLEEQLNTPVAHPQMFEKSTRRIWKYFKKRLVRKHGASQLNGEGNNPALPYKWYFRMAWWHHTLRSRKDLLRQRIALALSEILVISDNSSLELNSIGIGSYYDLLYKHAFGNYGDLLYDVSMHPTMGVYLSHMNNQKANKAQRIHPDENYAREIMQLFSIGLFELNMDGSEKLDAAGKPIPTYDNRDIKELARVFTGLHAHSYEYEWTTQTWKTDYNGYPVTFNDGVEKKYKTVPFVNMTRSMKFSEKYHDRKPKRLLNGHIYLRGGQSGRSEVRQVVRQLVSHPSTAPFVAKHMINRLVTSNPSPQYVEAVARAFGPKGDMKAMVRELLTFPLRRPVSNKLLKGAYKDRGRIVQSQKLKSPLQRTTQLLLAFRAYNRSKRLWILGDDIQESMQQHPLSAPTVFNFYKPDYAPHGKIQKAKLVAPEFEIHTSATSVAYVNYMYYWFFGEYMPLVSAKIGSTPEVKMVMEMDPYKLAGDSKNKLRLNFAAEVKMARNPALHGALIDRMSILLTGRRNLKIKSKIRRAFSSYADNPLWVVQTIAFMIAISPEFTVQEA